MAFKMIKIQMLLSLNHSLTQDLNLFWDNLESTAPLFRQLRLRGNLCEIEIKINIGSEFIPVQGQFLMFTQRLKRKQINPLDVIRKVILLFKFCYNYSQFQAKINPFQELSVQNND
ncbi:Hypothetical_protein [Hexamita inflata]|uniref:Hypothetical_protein n=1 Tax=Hexamita inflata TaxID=28002 RepID=A0ABP1HMM4_9EUKA